MSYHSKLVLPNGREVKNRILKSALSEYLADSRTNQPNKLHETLYKTWAEGGIGIVITGNAFVDREHLESPTNVVMDEETDRNLLKSWAQKATSSGAICLVQLSHPGRQAPVSVTLHPVAPSNIRLKPGGRGWLATGTYCTPRALSTKEIYRLISKFKTAAKIAEEAGFSGVQLHAAHGYLISQFLSPNVNNRTDEFGEKRTLFLRKILEEVRSCTNPSFIVSIKINSSDFRRGGFTHEMSLETIGEIRHLIDFVEISGGTYENPAMCQDKDGPGYTEFSKRVKQEMDIIVAVTGGFRSRMHVENALKEGLCDIVGMGRPLILTPDLPKKIDNLEDFPDQRFPKPSFIPFETFWLEALQAPVSVWWFSERMRQVANSEQIKLGCGTSELLYLLTVRLFWTYLWDLNRDPFLKSLLRWKVILPAISCIILLMYDKSLVPLTLFVLFAYILLNW